MKRTHREPKRLVRLSFMTGRPEWTSSKINIMYHPALSLRQIGSYLYIFSFFFLSFFLPVIVSVACSTGPHPPPLRLALRPNRGHIGGGERTPPAVHACDVF